MVIAIHIVNLMDLLEQSVTQLLFLSSLTLVIAPVSSSAGSMTVREIQNATKVLLRMDPSTLRNVEVTFHQARLSMLGHCVSSESDSIAACKALEEALLRFRCRRVDVRPSERKARTAFWSPAIRNAFQRLSEQELLTFLPRSGERLQNDYPVQSFYNVL